MWLGIDTGGTFTDCVLLTAEGLQVFKTPSTPAQPAQAIFKGLDSLLPEHQPLSKLTHGTTVATNAFLERKGAKTALITTAGFRDLIEIGRQNRPYLYSLNPQRPQPLVPAKWRFEISERMDAQGHIVVPLDEAEPLSLPPDIESVAVCFLFSYLNPIHEQRVAEQVRNQGKYVTASGEYCPEFREYERFSSAVINAYLQPVMARYLDVLATQTPYSWHLMKSSGGIAPLSQGGSRPADFLLSGPAGGVLGAHKMAQEHQLFPLLTFDMGGTSTDVALVGQSLTIQRDKSFGGLPLKAPMLDIHTVGAGGGSLITVDAAGVIRVGPESAGADPGPMAYGKGHDLTITDAQLFLGRIQPRFFKGAKLEPSALKNAFEALARPLGLSPEAFAEGALRIANANMERALRVVSVEQGEDPAEHTLFCFGGAGGLHACDLANALHMSRVFVPVHAGVFSALGMLYAPLSETHSMTVLGQDITDLEPFKSRLFQRLHPELQGQNTQLSYHLDLRYQGQAHDLHIPLGPDFKAQFHQRHQTLFGYHRPETPIETVALTLRAQQIESLPSLPTLAFNETTEPMGCYSVYFEGTWQKVPFYQTDQLQFPQQGPLVVVADTYTLWVNPQFQVSRLPQGHVVMEKI